jgi:hypothetical protein
MLLWVQVITQTPREKSDPTECFFGAQMSDVILGVQVTRHRTPDNIDL